MVSDPTLLAVRVAVRCRPLSETERANGNSGIVSYVKGEPQIIVGEDRVFTFDHIYPPSSSQEDIFRDCALPLVDGCFEGINATVLAYGQTGSGKTFTMGSSSGKNFGVIPRVFERIFATIEQRASVARTRVKMSFLEIFNDDIRDLLEANPSSAVKNIREDGSGGVCVSGLIEEPTSSPSEMTQLLEKGSQFRSTASTMMNEVSSRSHAIVTISIEQTLLDEESGEDSGVVLMAKLHLVDLAGSERVKKTMAEGARFKEGVNINKGLLALGNVINALSDEKRRAGGHIPYRDSKLTRMLQDSLGGNSRTVLIACVSPADSNMEETINTLKYANRAREIKNKPISNLSVDADEINRLKAENKYLLTLVRQGSVVSTPQNSDLESRIETMKNELKETRRELTVAAGQALSFIETATSLEAERDALRAILSENNIDLPPSVISLSAVSSPLVPTDLGLSGLSSESPLDPLNDEEATLHAERQKQFGSQLFALGEAMKMKQELLAQLSRAGEADRQDAIALQTQVATLTSEKEMLMAQLAEKRGGVAEDSKLKNLETQLTSLRAKQAASERLISSRSGQMKEMQKLQQEVVEMKTAKINLMKKMREEAEKFRETETERKRECARLKREQQKQSFEVQKLTAAMDKISNVLRRKTEEASSATKRLKSFMQGRAANSISKSSAQIKSQGSAATSAPAAGGAQASPTGSVGKQEMLDFISSEVNAMVGLRDARRMLAEHRNSQRLMAEAAKKSKDNVEKKEISEKLVEMKKEETRLERDIKDAEEAFDTPGSSRWAMIENLDDAASALSALFELAVSANVQAGQYKVSADETKLKLAAALKDCSELRGQLNVITFQKEGELAALALQHEKQLRDLSATGELNSTGVVSKSTIKLQSTHLENLRTIASLQAEVDSIRLRLAESESKTSVAAPPPPAAAKKSRKVTPVDETDDEDFEFESESGESGDEEDEEWLEEIEGKKNRKRKSGERRNKKETKLLAENIDDLLDDDKPVSCTCKGQCKRNCPCRDARNGCNKNCKCRPSKCANRHHTHSPSDPSLPDTTSPILINSSSDLSLSVSPPTKKKRKNKTPKKISPESPVTILEVSPEIVSEPALVKRASPTQKSKPAAPSVIFEESPPQPPHSNIITQLPDNWNVKTPSKAAKPKFEPLKKIAAAPATTLGNKSARPTTAPPSLPRKESNFSAPTKASTAAASATQPPRRPDSTTLGPKPDPKTSKPIEKKLTAAGPPAKTPWELVTEKEKDKGVGKEERQPLTTISNTFSTSSSSLAAPTKPSVDDPVKKRKLFSAPFSTQLPGKENPLKS